jgi:hypothetical protein
MLKRLLAAGMPGLLAGCVVGPGGAGYGYYDQGYSAQPVYGYAPAAGFGQVDIAVRGHRDRPGDHDHHASPSRGDWHGSREDGAAHPQGTPPAAATNGGRDPNWRGANSGAGAGSVQQNRQAANPSNGRRSWQRNGNGSW